MRVKISIVQSIKSIGYILNQKNHMRRSSFYEIRFTKATPGDIGRPMSNRCMASSMDDGKFCPDDVCLLCLDDLLVTLIFLGRPFFPGDTVSMDWADEPDIEDMELREDGVLDIVE